MDVSKEFTLLKLVAREDGDGGELFDTRRELRLGPSRDVVASAASDAPSSSSSPSEGEEERGGRRITLLGLGSGRGQQRVLGDPLPGRWERFCWISKRRLLSASRGPGGEALRVCIHQVEAEPTAAEAREAGRQESGASGIQSVRGGMGENTNELKYIIGDAGAGSFELEDCLRDFGRVAEIAHMAVDGKSETCSLVVRSHTGSEAVLTFRSFRRHIHCYPVVQFSALSIQAICVKGQLVVAHVHPSLLYAWNVNNCAIIWHHKLPAERRKHFAAFSKLDLHFGPRDDAVVALGTDAGHIAVLEPIGSFPMSIRRAVARAKGSEREADGAAVAIGNGSRAHKSIVVDRDYENLHRFHCLWKRSILPVFKGSHLDSLAFHNEKLLSVHRCGDSGKLRLVWSEAFPQSWEDLEYSRAERVIEVGQAVPLQILPDSLVLANASSVFCILPKVHGRNRIHNEGLSSVDSHLVEKSTACGEMSAARFSWLADFLVSKSVSDMGRMIELNGVCRSEDEKLLMMIQAALQRYDIGLVEKLVPDIIGARPALWVASARYLILEMVILLFRHPLLHKSVIPRFAKVIIRVLKQASVAKCAREAQELSKYLQVLRGFESKRGSQDKLHEQPGVGAGAFPPQGSSAKDSFKILKAGLSANRVSEAVFKLLSLGLDSFDSSHAPNGFRGNVGPIINTYIIHLIQNASFEEVQDSLAKLDICPKAVLENIFWSAFSTGIRKRTMENLNSLHHLSEDVLRAAKIMHMVETAYKGEDIDPSECFSGSLDYASVIQSFAADLSAPAFTVQDVPSPDIRIDLETLLQVEGVLGHSWPKKATFTSVDDDDDDLDGEGEGDERESRGSLGEAGSGVSAMPASWFGEWTEETFKKVIIEGLQMSSGNVSDRVFSDYWACCLSYACVHDRVDLLFRALAGIPETATCPGQLKVRINQREVVELPMAVFMPTLPDGLSSLVQNHVSHSLARQGIFQRLYWPSALELLAFCEKSILNATPEIDPTEVERMKDYLQSVSAIYCSNNKLPNLALLYDRLASSNTLYVADALKNTDDLSWCSWLPIAQNTELCDLSCALNTSIVCHLDLHMTDRSSIQAVDGIGNYLHSLPLLGFESDASRYFEPEFWGKFREELVQNGRLQETYPTLASFLREMSADPSGFKSNDWVKPQAEEEVFIAVRNALLACSSQSFLLLSNFPSHLPQWTKKLVHLSSSIRQHASSARKMAKLDLRERFLRQERDVEKYIENDYFVLPYESSLNLKIQNHLMHGRSFASIHACLTSEETRAMVEKGLSWEEMRVNNDFVSLERTSYCSALSNFQDETVVSSCVLTLQLLSEDTYALQLVVLALRYVVLCIDNGLVAEPFPFSVDSFADGSDVLTPVVQLICDDIKKGLKLGAGNAGIAELHKGMAAILAGLLAQELSTSTDIYVEDGGVIDTKVSTWILLNALNELCGFERDDSYMTHLAGRSDWVTFLAESERHGYALREVMALSSGADKELRCHLERALVIGGDAKAKAEAGAGAGAGEKADPPELFALLSDSEKQESPGAFLLGACVQWRWPFLAVLSSCYDDISKFKCFQYWLGSTCLSTAFLPERHDIPHLVSLLCEKKCYLPLIRAGETFFPKSIFVTFMYFLHSFVQVSLRDAERYLTQFKQMMDRQEGRELDPDNWMMKSLATVLEASLSSHSSNAFTRTQAMRLFKRCEVLQHFANFQRVYVLYDLLGEKSYDAFVSWRSAEDAAAAEGLEGAEAFSRPRLRKPVLTVDIEGAASHLEEGNRWGEARLLYKRCGLPTHDIVLRHAERMLRDLREHSAKMDADVQRSWNDIHALFMESGLPARRAGDFFLKQFDQGVSYATVSDSLFVLELAFKWYQGLYSNAEPCCSPDFLEDIRFQGLICRHVIALANQHEQVGKVAEDQWYIPTATASAASKHSSFESSAKGAGASGSFMIGSLEHRTLLHYMGTCGTKSMGSLLLTMLFNAFVWYGEIDHVKKLSTKLKEVKGIQFLEALVKILAEHGDDAMAGAGAGGALSTDCFAYLQELLLDHEVPEKVIDAVCFCAEKIPREPSIGLEFATRVAFSFELSAQVAALHPNLVLRAKPEATLQLLLRQGTDLLPHTKDFVRVFSVSAAKVADVLVKSYFKGLLAVFRDVPEESSATSYEPAYSTEEFDRCAFLCEDKQELGHALLNIILTKHHLPSEFEVEVIILAYQYYESAHAMNGVDVLTTLAFGRVASYSSLGEFKAIVRMLNGIGESKLRQFAIEKLVSSDKLELLLKKRTSNDSKERTVSRRRNLKREILAAIQRAGGPPPSPLPSPASPGPGGPASQSPSTAAAAEPHLASSAGGGGGISGAGGDGEGALSPSQRDEAFTMALQHFNKTKQIAQGILQSAREKATEDPAEGSLLYSEAASLFQSIGCVKNALKCACRARDLAILQQDGQA